MKSGYARNLELKYHHYFKDGKLVLTVTLSTYVRSNNFAASDRMRHFWDQQFMHRVKKQLAPWQWNQIDHDFLLEESPDGYWHFHGLLAFTPETGRKIWKDGALNRHLARDLDSFRTAGAYRSFRVNEYLIEPIRDGMMPEFWTRYITKTSNFLCWARDERTAVSSDTECGAEPVTINIRTPNLRKYFDDQHRRNKSALEIPKAA